MIIYVVKLYGDNVMVLIIIQCTYLFDTIFGFCRKNVIKQFFPSFLHVTCFFFSSQASELQPKYQYQCHGLFMQQFMSNLVKIYHNSKRNSKEGMKQQPTFPIVDKVIVLQLQIPERPLVRQFDISSAWSLSSYSSRSQLYIPVAQKQFIAILHVVI